MLYSPPRINSVYTKPVNPARNKHTEYDMNMMGDFPDDDHFPSGVSKRPGDFCPRALLFRTPAAARSPTASGRDTGRRVQLVRGMVLLAGRLARQVDDRHLLRREQNAQDRNHETAVLEGGGELVRAGDCVPGEGVGDGSGWNGALGIEDFLSIEKLYIKWYSVTNHNGSRGIASDTQQ